MVFLCSFFVVTVSPDFSSVRFPVPQYFDVPSRFISCVCARQGRFKVQSNHWCSNRPYQTCGSRYIEIGRPGGGSQMTWLASMTSEVCEIEPCDLCSALILLLQQVFRDDATVEVFSHGTVQVDWCADSCSSAVPAVCHGLLAWFCLSWFVKGARFSARNDVGAWMFAGRSADGKPFRT